MPYLTKILEDPNNLLKTLKLHRTSLKTLKPLLYCCSFNKFQMNYFLVFAIPPQDPWNSLVRIFVKLQKADYISSNILDSNWLLQTFQKSYLFNQTFSIFLRPLFLAFLKPFKVLKTFLQTIKNPKPFSLPIPLEKFPT